MKRRLLTLFALLMCISLGAMADVTPFSESYSSESTTDGWTTSVEGRFTPVILNIQGDYFMSVTQNQRNNNGCIVTGTILSGKAKAGDDFTLSFDMWLMNSNNQTPVMFQIKDAANVADIFSLTATGISVDTWKVNGTDLQVTLPGSSYSSACTFLNYTISRSGSLTYLTITNKKSGDAVLERTLLGGVSETGGLGNIVFTTKRYNANFAIDNIVLRELQDGDVPQVAKTTYTIKYLDESGVQIKDDIVIESAVGMEVTANASQTASVTYDGKKYLYKEGNQSLVLVGDAAKNVITLVYHEAATYNYTVNAIYGDKQKVLVSGSGTEGDVIAYNIPEFVADGTNLYYKAPVTTNPHFGGTVTLDADKTIDINYNDDVAMDVVFYKEAEEIDGFTPLTTNNADIRCSNGKGGIINGTEPVVLTTLPAGTYTIFGQVWGTTGYAATITANGNTLWTKSSVGYRDNSVSEPFTLTEETTLYISNTLGEKSQYSMLDLIYIQKANETYIAVFDGTSTLTFKKGIISMGASNVYDATDTGDDVPGWNSLGPKVKTVVFDASFADARPKSCGHWFQGFTALADIEGLANLNTSDVTTMLGMFRNCKALTSLDLTSFNTESVRDMGYMFYNDIKLASINLNKFNTSNVEDMSYMFGYCPVTSLDLGSFNTSNVVNMQGMFYNCKALTSLDLSGFNAEKVDNTGGMFYNCDLITSIKVPENVRTIGTSAFVNCTHLAELRIPKTVTSIGNYAFYGCTGLTDVYCHAKEVPTTASDAFGNVNISDVMLHVPTASIEAYKTNEPWSGFGNFGSTQCATPVISLVDGKLNFTCETEGVEYVYHMSPVTEINGNGSEMALPKTTVTVYATKDGYDNSDVATKEITFGGTGTGDLRGDLNGDGTVNMQDVMFIVNKVLNGKFPDEE